MKIKFMGKFNNDPESLPSDPITAYSNKLIEPDNYKNIMIIFSIVLLFVFGAIFCLRTGISKINNVGILLWVLSVIPHELIHATAFKEVVYLYFNLPFGAFVYSQGHLKKSEFITMSLMPNIVFGFIPFAIYLLFPTFNILGTFGLCAIISGAGDYLNVYNVVKQVPSKAYVYMNKMDTYWYDK